MDRKLGPLIIYTIQLNWVEKTKRSNRQIAGSKLIKEEGGGQTESGIRMTSFICQI